jgi:hypothetical protein
MSIRFLYLTTTLWKTLFFKDSSATTRMKVKFAAMDLSTLLARNTPMKKED